MCDVGHNPQVMETIGAVFLGGSVSSTISGGKRTHTHGGASQGSFIELITRRKQASYAQMALLALHAVLPPLLLLLPNIILLSCCIDV